MALMEKIDKARKLVSIWGQDAKRLKRLSHVTERTQVELLHEAIAALERRVEAEKAHADAK
jgi:hypothetical protein